MNNKLSRNWAAPWAALCQTETSYTAEGLQAKARHSSCKENPEEEGGEMTTGGGGRGSTGVFASTLSSVCFLSDGIMHVRF